MAETTWFNLPDAVFDMFDDFADVEMGVAECDVVDYLFELEPGLSEQRVIEVIDDWVAYQLFDRRGTSSVKGTRWIDLHRLGDGVWTLCVSQRRRLCQALRPPDGWGRGTALCITHCASSAESPLAAAAAA